MVIAVAVINLICTMGYDHAGDRKLAWEASGNGYSWSGKHSRLGYKPVPDVLPSSRQDDTGKFDNYLYKKWCEETFDNGEYIYAAYRDIAFNVRYQPEARKADFWQTPIETDRLKKGDCEDAVFLFFSQLPSNQEAAEIVWGWVIDNQSKVTRPHVWYQLKDKRGQKYIVEGFSKNWNGIIPMETAEEYESRKPILTIPHSKISELSDLLLKANAQQVYWSLINILKPTDSSSIDIDNQDHLLKAKAKPHYFNYELVGHRVNTQDRSWNPANHIIPRKTRKEIISIFNKLRKMFMRYDEQKAERYT